MRRASTRRRGHGDQAIAVERHHHAGRGGSGHGAGPTGRGRAQGQGGGGAFHDLVQERDGGGVAGVDQASEQAGRHGGLDQRHGAAVGTVHLDGCGQVGQRGGGPAGRLGQGHGRQPHGHDGVPEHRIEAGRLHLAHPLAVRLLAVEALGGLPEGVLVGAEGEVHRGGRLARSRF